LIVYENKNGKHPVGTSQMNNWLLLNSDQIHKIRSEVPSFDEIELQYRGSINLNREFIGGEYVYDNEIYWLEINLNGKWITIINECLLVKSFPLNLTEDQYENILEELTK
jgi:hypothetical protein